MADDDKFTVTTAWQAVEANGADITNGTFTVFSHSNHRVDFWKSENAPTDSNGPAFFDTPAASLKYTLGATEELYCKTGTGSVEIGVIPS